jgi:uncharacterized protein (TIGR02646 family)
MNNWYNNEDDKKLVMKYYLGKETEWENNYKLKPVKDRIKKYLEAINEEKCFYCKSKFDSYHFSPAIEHIVPKSIYPQFAFEFKNLTISCDKCNSRKRAQNTLIADDILISVYPIEKESFNIVHAYLDEYDENIKIVDGIFYEHSSSKGINTISMFKLYDIELALSNARKLSLEKEDVNYARKASRSYAIDEVENLCKKISELLNNYPIGYEAELNILKTNSQNSIYNNEENNIIKDTIYKDTFDCLTKQQKEIGMLFDNIHESNFFSGIAYIEDGIVEYTIQFISSVFSESKINNFNVDPWIDKINDILAVINITLGIKSKNILNKLITNIEINQESLNRIPYLLNIKALKKILSLVNNISYYKINKIKKFIEYVKTSEECKHVVNEL